MATNPSILIPGNLNIPWDHPLHDQLLILTNYILNKWSRRRGAEFISLGKDELRSVVGGAGGRYGARVRDALEELGMIRVCHSYRTAHYPKSVVVCDEYLNVPLREVSLKRKPRASAALILKRPPTRIEQFLLSHLGCLQAAHISLADVIDAKQAGVGRDLSGNQRLCLTTSLQGFKIGKLWGKTVARGNRFFSSFTQAPREVRQRLHYKADPLIQIDVRQCHPALLEKILSDHIKGETIGVTDINLVNKFIRKKRSPSSQIPSMGEQVSRLRELVGNGDFYSEFYPAYAEIEAGKKRKRAVKQGFCTMAYGNPQWGCLEKPFGKRFKSLFPDYFQALLEIKTQLGLDAALPPQQRHKQLSWRLQAMEAACVITDVCEGVMEDGSKAPILTIHDCIATTPKYADEVEGRLIAAFRQRWGVNVSCEREMPPESEKSKAA